MYQLIKKCFNSLFKSKLEVLKNLLFDNVACVLSSILIYVIWLAFKKMIIVLNVKHFVLLLEQVDFLLKIILVSWVLFFSCFILIKYSLFIFNNARSMREKIKDEL